MTTVPELVASLLVPKIREFIVQEVGADMGPLMTKQAEDLALVLVEPVKDLLAEAWEDGARKASPHGGAYVRSILIQNPYSDSITDVLGALS